MKSTAGAPSPTKRPLPVRTIIEAFDREFLQLDAHTRDLLNSIPVANLYDNPLNTELGSAGPSAGELLLRGAGVVEQTFGGLTANLWDDPFEWTLAETLSTPALVLEYLDEVEQTRRDAFARFTDDSDLAKLIAMPSGEAQPLVRVLLNTLVRAAGYQGRAAVILRLLLRGRPLPV